MAKDNQQQVIVCGIGPTGITPLLVDPYGNLIITNASWKAWNPTLTWTGGTPTLTKYAAAYFNNDAVGFFALDLDFITPPDITKLVITLPWSIPYGSIAYDGVWLCKYQLLNPLVTASYTQADLIFGSPGTNTATITGLPVFDDDTDVRLSIAGTMYRGS